MASRRRFAVPAILAGLIGIGAVVPAALAGSTPDLPAVTASQLVADVLTPQVPALSGTVDWAPQLGLPAIGPLLNGGGQGISSAGALDPVTLLTSDETFRLWIDGSRERVAAVSDLAETDILHVGDQLWVWDSATQHVTHYVYAGDVPPVEASPPTGADPQAFAAQVLTDLDSAGTTVSVGDPVDVAGRSAYVLRLAPTAAASSTVSFIDIAVDAATHAVLQVSIEASGQTAPALQVGFTSIDFGTPPPSAFTPPRGTSTTTRSVGGGADFGWFGYAPLTEASGVSGAGPSVAVHEPPPLAGQCVASESSSGSVAYSSTLTFCPDLPTTIGKGWSTVLSLPSSSVEPQLRRAATPVSGSWGSGGLVTSSLLNALLQPGRVLVGFVPVAVLEADAASAGS